MPTEVSLGAVEGRQLSAVVVLVFARGDGGGAGGQIVGSSSSSGGGGGGGGSSSSTTKSSLERGTCVSANVVTVVTSRMTTAQDAHTSMGKRGP